MDLSFLYRDCQNGFINLQTNGFGEGSNSSNEKGVYVGFQPSISRNIKILGYYDLYRFPWLRFQANGPSSGDDFWIEAIYKPNKQFQAYYRFRTETKQSNLTTERAKQIAEETTSRHRLHISYKINKALELRNRIEWSLFSTNSASSSGSLIYQDILYKPFGIKMQITGRIAYSQIESFENCIYSFEQSPLYDYPLFTHGFSGLRLYLMTRYKPTRNTDVWFKYGYIQHDVPLNQFAGNYTTGSGLASTSGNQRHTFTVQFRYTIK